MSNEQEQLGPLPIVDRNAEIETASKHAMQVVLGGTNLILREWTGRDYGVDAAIEVTISNCATNFVSHIQLKGTDYAKVNADGSVSFSVDVSNLNYLLNGTCPMYVLFSLTHNRLWYVWAVDELRRLEAENPAWMEQGSVTIRFHTDLNTQSVAEIVSRLIEESKSRRKVLDSLASLSTATLAKIQFDPRRLIATDADDAYRILKEEGITLVASGLWREALSKIDILPLERQREPSIQIILAYAYFMQGRCLTALGCCGEAMLRKGELSSAEAEILHMLRDACDCQLGRIDRLEYTRRQVEAASSEHASSQCKLEAARFRVLEAHDDTSRIERHREFSNLAKAVLDDPSVGHLQKLQTRILAAFLDGFQAQLAMTRSIGQFHIQRVLKQSWALPDPGRVLDGLTDFLSWEQRMGQLIRDAAAFQIPWLLGEAKRTHLLVRTAVLGFQRFFAKLQGGDPETDGQVIKELLAYADEVAGDFAKAGHLELELRAKIAKADVLEIAHDQTSAKQIAAEVLPIAEAMALEETARLARQHLNGATLLQRTERQMLMDREGGADAASAAMTDSDIDYFAEAYWSVSQLPKERLPMMRKDVEALRIISRQRRDWCQHLEQQQMLAHTKRRETAYAAPTQWLGMCKKHNLLSLQLGDDFEIVIEKFKVSYCKDCPDRSPGKEADNLRE